MDAQEYEEMLRRIMALTVTLGAAIDRHDARMERYEELQEQHEARMEAHEARMEAHEARMIWYDGVVADLREFNRQQVVINKRLEETQASIKALLERVIPPSENGREA